MAISVPVRVGTPGTGTTTTSVSTTLSSAVAAGETVLVAITWGANNGTTRTVTDTRGNTYTERSVDTTTSATVGCASIFEATITTALQIGDTITFQTTQSVNAVTVTAYDCGGLQTSPFDQQSAGHATSNAPSSGNVTTLAANELLFSVMLHTSGTPTAGTGFTLLDHTTTETSHFQQTEYEIVSATGTYAATYAGLSSQGWVVCLVTLKGSTGSPPVNTVAPALTGTAHVGQTLTSGNGTWTDDGSPTFTYQWQRDNSGGGTFSNIVGETTSTHTLVDADDGCQVRCVVTDNTPDGNTAANSNALAVTYAAPTNTVAPVVSGSASVGAVLSCDTGTWTT